MTQFLQRSSNSTLYHQLDFLAYHPEGRHTFHHLLFFAEDRLVAFVPGALCPSQGGLEYRSCPGASFGGPAYEQNIRLRGAEAVLRALVSYCEAQRFVGVRLVLPPAAYNGRVGELTTFLAARAGFQTYNQQVSFLVPLHSRKPDAFEALFRSSTASQVRGARRKGVSVKHGGIELLEHFLVLFESTYARHDTRPTHTPGELRHLAAAFPERIIFYVAYKGLDPLAALCVFKITREVATTFYICVDYERRNENGVLSALAFAIDQLAADGSTWLDLGPSGDLRNLNIGVIDFKESAGAHYGLRGHWHLPLQTKG